MSTKALISILVLFLLLASCNMPAGQVPATQPLTKPSEVAPVSLDAEAIGTAVELTAAARLTEIAGSVTPTSTPVPTQTVTPTSSVPTQCTPLVTATVNANVRSGPDTAYDIIGALNLGQTASIVGRNDAYTWWYISYPAVAGGHAWIAGSVVTSSCVPAVVQVVAAPPLPTAVVADNSDDAGDAGDQGNDNGPLSVLPGLSLQAIRPDLTVTGMQVTPNPAKQNDPVQVKVKVKNQGTFAASSFSVAWWATSSEIGCSWPVDSLAAGASKTLDCSYTYSSFNDAFPIQAVVDAGGAINESDEGNNSTAGTLQVWVDIQMPDLPDLPDFPFP